MADPLLAEGNRAAVTRDSIGDAVVSTDIAGNITFLNLVAEKITGWSRKEATGRPMPEVLRILDSKSRDTIPNPMELIAGKKVTEHLPPNCLLVRRDETEIPIEDSVAPIHNRE